MSYHYDWLMRQIEIISAMLAYILAQKKNSIRSVEEAQAVPSGEKSCIYCCVPWCGRESSARQRICCLMHWKILARWCWMRRFGFIMT